MRDLLVFEPEFRVRVRNELRLQAVRAVRKGMTQTEAARTFEVSRATVGGWVKLAKTGGIRALKERRRGRPPGGGLLPRYEAQVEELIAGRYPDELGLRDALWTRAAVQQLIARRHGLKVSVWTVGRYLERAGLNPEHLLNRVLRQGQDAVVGWFHDGYQSIRNQAKRESAEIHWVDAVGRQQDLESGRSRDSGEPRMGTSKAAPNIRGFLISSRTNRGELAFEVSRTQPGELKLIGFLERLLRQRRRRRLFLLVAERSAFGSAAVRRWLDAQEAIISLFLVPE